MKCSGWSSRVIWVSSAAAALTLAPAALAHVDVSPGRIDPGADAQLVFAVPNEQDVAITRVAIGLPPDVQLGEIGMRAGWRTMRAGRSAAWEGGTIRPGELVNFELTVTAPRTSERAVFSVLLSLANGRTDTYHPSLEIAPAPRTTDEGTRTLAEAALIVASVAVLLALGGGFLALWLWLRPRPPDPF